MRRTRMRSIRLFIMLMDKKSSTHHSYGPSPLFRCFTISKPLVRVVITLELLQQVGAYRGYEPRHAALLLVHMTKVARCRDSNTY